jgi:hypothetical protein
MKSRSWKSPVKLGPLVPQPNDKFVPLHDNLTDQTYLARVGTDGSLSSHARAHTGMSSLTAEQYQLIAWCMWRKRNGWTSPEVTQVLRYFWHNEPGQPPLSDQSVNGWWRVHLAHKKEGMEWPS